ncbi:hypothetical protein HBI56_125720 [Parastagonospora nodorum]|uniref:Uncharacterized protein n=1 Tax=Phaeosphaeria nodorum (strain SN15 / ATCC MYA-4574 / FGSC 10173) TaxID=321614 RepID=A0A7U2F4L6_PHANO|nr:hypothetical protein HBH56_167060 [Parastagonospora nodorum]QRC98597.1 hypothetical protein JI435_412340 [Parastagonospora nodorum SN15]KAH3936360.1 hypothetical protein HBH54_030140 [Parastagonospora nodorum]KAH3948249.1 hypothetical protein HBH53_104950 [Parastagonospora nodorum]KAH3968840.1 hypothetical protein HBH51_128850 [Parastagonospora nodorum]
MARCTDWDALFPAQDEEDWISSCVLGNCLSMGGTVVEYLDGRMAIGLNILIHGSLRIAYRSRIATIYIQEQALRIKSTPDASLVFIIVTPSLRLFYFLLDLRLRLGRHGRHALERTLRIFLDRVPIDAISRALRKARRGVLSLSRSSSYRDMTISVQ